MNFISMFDGLWNFFGPALSALATLFTSHAGIFLYCLIIVGWTIIAAIKFHRRITPVQNQLKTANKALGESSPDDFVNKYYEFDDICLQLPVLRHCWREFTEVLLFPGTDFEDGEQICNTQQPGNYLSQRTVLWPHVPMRFYNALPNMLTGLGILGTFIGLVAGISLAAPGLNSSDIQDAKSALEQLLSGASLAFLTSIFGLTTSIIFSWYEKKRIFKFDNLLNQLVGRLEKRLEYLSSEKIASKAFLETQKQTASLESFSNDLAVSLGDLLENKITEPMNSTMMNLGKIMEEQKTILEGLREDQQKASDETLERLIEKFSESIASSAGKEMSAFADTIETLSEKLENQIATMAQGQVAMQEASQKGVQNLQDSFEKQNETIAENQLAMQRASQDSVQNLQNSFEKQIMTLNQTQEAMQKASQESVQNLQNSFQENTELLQEKVGAAITTMVKGVRATVGEMTQMLQDATSESAANMRQVSEQFGSSIEALETTVGNMTDKLQEATKESAENMHRVSQQFDDSITALKDTVNDMSEINEGTQKVLSELDTLTEAIKQSQDELLKAAVPMQEAASEMHETSSSIKDAAGMMSETGTHLQNNIDLIKMTHDNLKQSWDSYQQRFENVDSSLAKIFEGLEQGLATYASSTQEYVEKLDQHASKVVTHLAGATSELGDTLEGFEDTLGSMEKNTANVATHLTNATSELGEKIEGLENVLGSMKTYTANQSQFGNNR